MTRLLVFLLFTMASVTGLSQKVYFIYLQTEDEQPFYVKMDSQVQSSSLSGYLILSKLRDSVYNFTVGFPKEKWPEQRFSIGINKKDHGYIIKNFGEKGWGLYDLQTMDIRMALPGSAGNDKYRKEGSNPVSAFSEALSKASDDASLLEESEQPQVDEKPGNALAGENPIKEIPEEKSKGVAEQTAIKTENPDFNRKEKEVVNTVEIPVPKPYKPSTVSKRSESSTTDGLGLVFTDEYGDGIIDTIRIFIPNPVSLIRKSEENPANGKKFLDMPADTVKKKAGTNLS